MKKVSVTKNRLKNNALGQAIRYSRVLRGVNLSDIADHLGLSLPFMSDVEKGKRNLSDERIQSIAELLQISPIALLKTAAKDRGKVTLDVSSSDAESLEVAVLLSQMWGRVPKGILEPLLNSLKESQK